jgi:hypothetical protein
MRILCFYHFSGRGESSSVMFFSSFHAMAMYLAALADETNQRYSSPRNQSK